MNQGGLILLDGLDEVPEADLRREQIKQVVEDFTSIFMKCRILVTSRTYAYKEQAWRLFGFDEAVLASFSKGQIHRFIDRWYAHIAGLRGLNPADAQGKAVLLKRAIQGSDRLYDLAERPILLTLMASLHAWRGGSLPEKREELYADAMSLLLDWWERPKIVRDAQGEVTISQPSLVEWLKADRDDVLSLLNELAFHAHAGQQEFQQGTADIPEGDLVSGLMDMSKNPDVKPKLLMKYLSERAGLVLPRGVGVYTLPHRTFQEYLAACYLTDHAFPEKLAKLARSDPGRWREVALLAGAKAARGTPAAIWLLVYALCYRPLEDQNVELADAWGAHLAGLALVESSALAQMSEANESRLAMIRQWLEKLIQKEYFPALERALAGRSLARLGDCRPEVMTVEEMPFCFVPAGPFRMGEGDEAHLQESMSEYWISQYPVTCAQ
ncbi:MAG: hypothetical protein GY845_09285, partial [Planctomycetes bacterium]|nr:hypothetical protein [Planctomycetota bacterium]